MSECSCVGTTKPAVRRCFAEPSMCCSQANQIDSACVPARLPARLPACLPALCYLTVRVLHTSSCKF